MLTVLRRYTKHFFIVSNVVLSVCILLLYALPYLKQQTFWFVNLIAMAFPVLIFLEAAFFIFWLLAKPRFIWLPILTFCLSFGLLRSGFGWHPFSQKQDADRIDFKVATWNVHLFNFFENKGELDTHMIAAASGLKADVLALQEFVFSLNPSSHMSLEQVKKRLGYRYAVTGNDKKFGVYKHTEKYDQRYFPFCVALFSNYPILRWEKVQSIREYNHTFIWADLLMGADTVRFMNVHLQSMHFAEDDYRFIENIDEQDVDHVKRNGMNIIRKIKAANQFRAVQIEAVTAEIRKSPYPVVLCGDFNDVPNSYAYQSVAQYLNDAYADKGWGMGRTFRKIAPTLRIDYIFSDKRLQAEQVRIEQLSFSDHYPLTVSFRKN